MASNHALQAMLESSWFHFVLVSLFAFLAGLEYRNYTLQQGQAIAWLNARTATLIGMLGFLLYQTGQATLFLGGLLLLAPLPWMTARDHPGEKTDGPIGLLLAMVIYSFGLLAITQPLWQLVLVFSVTTLTLTFHHHQSRLASVLEPGELATLAKFLLLAGVILPLLPDTRPFNWLPASPFKIWLGVVIISGISYFAYIIKKYLFTQQGYWVTGLLGGLYSSTATTVVLARKSRESILNDPSLPAGIIAATAMMYLRLLLLILLINPTLLPQSWLPLLGLALFTLATSRFQVQSRQRDAPIEHLGKENPLELGLALLFALLFLLMLALTQWVLGQYGIGGLVTLSALSGLTDIDPFVLSLLSGQYHQGHPAMLSGALLIAAGSNNLLKAVYTLTMGKFEHLRRAVIILGGTGVASILIGLWTLQA